MITRIALKNIRLYSDKEWNIAVPPLAIFCGTNSAGKSTILKTLLLLRQSQGIRESQGTERGRLKFAGSQVDVGDYASLVSHNDTSREIGIGITIEDKAPNKWIQFLKLYGGSSDGKQSANSTDPNEEHPYSISADFLFTGEIPPAKKRNSVDRCRLLGVLKSAKFIIRSEDKDILKWEVNLVPNADFEKEGQCYYEVKIPKSYFLKVGGSRMIDLDLTNRDECVKLATVLRGLLPDAVVGKVRRGKKEDEDQDEGWSHWPMPPHIDASFKDIRGALTKLVYLGPLRSPAKRFYLAHLDNLPIVDPTGESLPVVLRERSQELVWNCSFLANSNAEQMSLQKALNIWCGYFRTGKYNPSDADLSEVTLNVTSDVLVEIKLRNPIGNETHALTDSGFGFSQVLPIIVRGLLAEPNTSLIVEQPELHLNPALQVRIANFFAAMILAGKQVLLETHSEHIVNGIRALCAEDTSGKLHSKCGIFYLAVRDGVPNMQELSIRSDGMVPDWPSEFFGEAAMLSGRLLRAQKHQFKK